MNELNLAERFSFGKNWTRFLENLNEDRIREAEESLKVNLGCDDLSGKIFLDIGSGSGLFSLAAHRLGATVFSFDYDPDCVKCTDFLKTKYGNLNTFWSVEQGSVLDPDFLKKFNQVDIVYSWGVLHHTGQMDKAFENVSPLIKENGLLFISIYNDQGSASKRWLWIKKSYNNSSKIVKIILAGYTLIRQWLITFVKDFIKTCNPLKSWFLYSKGNRGMSAWHDIIDWTGGYPFEVAKPEQVFDFFKNKGFTLKKLKTCAGGLGCNEYIFQKQ